MKHPGLSLAVGQVFVAITRGQSSASNTRSSTAASSSYSTRSFNARGPATTYARYTDYSDQALAFLWDQVGPIATGPITTTVSPTPEPSVYPQPGPIHPLVPSYEPGLADVKLPAHFRWGVSSSAYQIEGAAKDEGKGPSIWDLLTHRVPNLIGDDTNADVAAQHYYLYKQDIARMKNLGIPSFTPSISWPRIFPFGKGPVNEAGVKHYDDVIKTLVDSGITPVVTLFHWDTPLALFNEYGAWNDRQIVDDFFNYAKFVIKRYDQYVDTWFTINEPQYCNWQFSGYPAGRYYPAYNNITGGDKSRFLCGHYTLLAHAKVAKWYHGEFGGRGRITFKNSGNYYEARNASSPADEVARRRSFDYSIGWFSGPWREDGGYPATLRDSLGPVGLLPEFTDEERKMIRGSCDFYALDGYTSYTAYGIADVERCVSNASHPAFPECAGSNALSQDGFPLGPAADPTVSWLTSAPGGIRRYLSFITKEYLPAVAEIEISEFGFAEPFESRFPSLTGALWDLRRADYLQSYLDAVLASIVHDGVNVTGAYAWAVFDNFEWYQGFEPRFGLQYVNYTDLSRTPKASMFQLLNWFKQHTAAPSGNSTGSIRV